MLVLLSEGGLAMYDNGGTYTVDGVNFKDLDQAVDFYMSLIPGDEQVIVDELGVLSR